MLRSSGIWKVNTQYSEWLDIKIKRHVLEKKLGTWVGAAW